MDSQTPAPVAAPVKHGARNTVFLIAVFALVAGAIYFVMNNGTQTFKGSMMSLPPEGVCPAGFHQVDEHTCLQDEVVAAPAAVQCPEGQIMGVDACMPDPAVQAQAEAQAQAELDRQNAEARAIADCVARNMQYDVASQQCVAAAAPLSAEEQLQADNARAQAEAQRLVDVQAACEASGKVWNGQNCGGVLDAQAEADAQARAEAQRLVDVQVACEASGKVWNGQNCGGNVNADLNPVIDPVADPVVAQEQPAVAAVVNDQIVNGSGGMVPNREVLDAPIDLHAAAQSNVQQESPVAAVNERIAAKVPAASKIAATSNKAKSKNKTASASAGSQSKQAKSSISIPVEAFANPDSLTAASVQDSGRTTVRGGVNGREIRGDTGPEMLLYPVLVGLANGAYLLKKKLRK